MTENSGSQGSPVISLDREHRFTSISFEGRKYVPISEAEALDNDLAAAHREIDGLRGDVRAAEDAFNVTKAVAEHRKEEIERLKNALTERNATIKRQRDDIRGLNRGMQEKVDRISELEKDRGLAIPPGVGVNIEPSPHPRTITTLFDGDGSLVQLCESGVFAWAYSDGAIVGEVCSEANFKAAIQQRDECKERISNVKAILARGIPDGNAYTLTGLAMGLVDEINSLRCKLETASAYMANVADVDVEQLQDTIQAKAERIRELEERIEELEKGNARIQSSLKILGIEGGGVYAGKAPHDAAWLWVKRACRAEERLVEAGWKRPEKEGSVAGWIAPNADKAKAGAKNDDLTIPPGVTINVGVPVTEATEKAIHQEIKNAARNPRIAFGGGGGGCAAYGATGGTGHNGHIYLYAAPQSQTEQHLRSAENALAEKDVEIRKLNRQLEDAKRKIKSISESRFEIADILRNALLESAHGKEEEE